MDRGRPRPKLLLQVFASALLILMVATPAVGQEPVQISITLGTLYEQVFREHISGPIVQSKCVNCHVEGGLSGHTRLVFVREPDASDHEELNLQAFIEFLDADDGHELILVKIQGAGHGGGEQVPVGSDDFDNMDRFLALLESETAAEAVFRDHISGPIVQSKCVNCHVQGGVSGHTRLVLVRSTEASDHEARNLQTFKDLLAAVEVDGGATYVLDKIQGMLSHGGGVQVAAGSDDLDDMDHFLELLEDEPQGFVARLLEALDDAETSMMFAITTPADEDTVAGSAVAVSATGAPTEAVHFAYRPDGDSEDGFAYLGAAANRGAALYAWDTSAMMDDAYELAALYAEDEGDSVIHDAIVVTLDNVEPAEDADIEEDPGRKEQAVRMDAMNEVATADGVMVTLPGGALDADDRITIEVTDFPDAEAAPGAAVGIGTIDITLDSGQSTFREAVTVAIPYPEGRPDGIVHGTDIAETELSLWYFDTAADAWEMVSGSTVNADADVVTADVMQTGEYGIFHTPMMTAAEDGVESPPDMMAMAGDGGGGGGCAMLPMLPPGGPPDDPTLLGLLALVTAYLLFGLRRPRPQAAMG